MKKIKGAVIFLVFGIAYLQVALAREASFQIVVNPANDLTSINQRFLADVFLKRTTFWPNKKNILPVDLNFESPVCQQFSEAILDRPVSAVRSYWQQLIFSGRGIPPPEMNSDQEVVNFVSSHEEAIGYVSVNADIRKLKTVGVR